MAEGLFVKETYLIEDGRFTEGLLTGPSARAARPQANGFSALGFGDRRASTTSNLYLKAGEKTPAEYGQAGKGPHVTDMFGPVDQSDTGDYSAGRRGLLFEMRDCYPVFRMTIAGGRVRRIFCAASFGFGS